MPVTYHKMKQFVVWKGMKSAVREFVQNCVICQQAKPGRSRSPGLLQPLVVPDAAWQHISMDFVYGLPQSGSVNCILVVVDYFTKYNHFVPLKHPYTAHSMSKLFLNQVYKLHGLPLSIVTDQDRIFTSHLWSTLFELAGVQLSMGSAYHPQSNG
jgi:transposase InsO family protein